MKYKKSTLICSLVLGTIMTIPGILRADLFNGPVWGVDSRYDADNCAGTIYVFGGSDFGDQNGGLLRSRDTGITFEALDAGLPNLYVSIFAINPTNESEMLVAVEREGIFRSVDGGNNWTSVLPNVTVYHLDWDSGGEMVFAGTEVRGIYRSNDGGQNWTLKSNGLRGMNVTDVVVAPNDPDHLYISYEGANTGGILRTLDGGATWQNVSPTTQRYTSVAISPTNPDIVYAGNGGPWGDLPFGIEVSDDGGDTWTHAWPVGEQDDVLCLHVPPSSPSSLLVGTQVWLGTSLPRILETTNLGGSFNELSVPSIEQTGISDITTRPDNSDVIFAVAQNKIGVLRSVDGGENFDVHQVGLNDGNASLLFNAVAIDPTNPSTVWVGGQGLYRSVDSGDSWEQIISPSDEMGFVNSLAFTDDGNLFVGGKGRVSFSDDGGVSFADLSAGLPYQPYDEIFRITVTNGSSPTVFIAMEDDGVHRLDPGTTTWQPIGPFGEDITDIRRIRENVIAAGYGYVYFSSDDGDSWQRASIDDYYYGVTHFAQGEADGEAWIACRTGLFHSTDSGQSWFKASSSDLETTSTFFAIETNPDDRNTMLLSKLGYPPAPAGTLYLSKDGGNSFIEVGQDLDPDHIARATEFAFLQNDPYRVWMSVGHPVYGTSELYHSHDGGITWSVPSPYVSEVYFEPGDELFLETEETADVGLEAIDHVCQPVEENLADEILLRSHPTSFCSVPNNPTWIESGIFEASIVAGDNPGSGTISADCNGCADASGDELAVTITKGNDPDTEVDTDTDTDSDSDTGNEMEEGNGSCNCRIDVGAPSKSNTLLLRLFKVALDEALKSYIFWEGN